MVGGSRGSFVQFAPKLKLRILPHWVDKSKGLLILRLEVENHSRIRVKKDRILLQILEHEIPVNGSLSGWVPFEKEVCLFNWNKLNRRNRKRIRRYLRDDLEIDLAREAKIRKNNESGTISISKGKNLADIMVDVEKKKAIVKISGGKIYDLIVKKENGKLNIHKKNIKPDEEPKEWHEPIEIFQSTIYINPEENLSVERLHHCPQDTILHIGIQAKAKMGFLGVLAAWLRSWDEQWTTTIIVLNSESGNDDTVSIV